MREVVAAAVRTDDWVIHFYPRPARHHNILHALHKAGARGIRGGQGFVMSDGSFAGRVEAGKCAIESGQIVELKHPPNLYSEDLW